MHDRYKDRGLTVLALSDETPSKISGYIKQHGIRYGVGRAQGVLRAFGETGYPSAWLIGPDGKVIWSGHPMELEAEQVEAHLSRVGVGGVAISSAPVQVETSNAWIWILVALGVFFLGAMGWFWFRTRDTSGRARPTFVQAYQPPPMGPPPMGPPGHMPPGMPPGPMPQSNWIGGIPPAGGPHAPVQGSNPGTGVYPSHPQAPVAPQFGVPGSTRSIQLPQAYPPAGPVPLAPQYPVGPVPPAPQWGQPAPPPGYGAPQYPPPAPPYPPPQQGHGQPPAQPGAPVQFRPYRAGGQQQPPSGS